LFLHAITLLLSTEHVDTQCVVKIFGAVVKPFLPPSNIISRQVEFFDHKQENGKEDDFSTPATQHNTTQHNTKLGGRF